MELLPFGNKLFICLPSDIQHKVKWAHIQQENILKWQPSNQFYSACFYLMQINNSLTSKMITYITIYNILTIILILFI